MSKLLKELMTDAVRRQYEGVDSVCVVDLTGLSVGATTKLRRSFRAKSVRIEVVKNSIAARAFRGGVLEPIGQSLQGPCALITGGDSIVEVAKALVQAAKEYTQITLKQAMLGGGPDLIAVEALAKLKSRFELLGELAALIHSPGCAVAGCIRSPHGKLAGCIEATTDRGE